MKKLFGQIDLTWKKLILFALVMGVYTALVSLIPQVHDTSLHTIAVTFEVWTFIGILIIMNSKSNIDSALKCFVFFLISQPLVYLLQVPFSELGWGLFRYYPYWFIWTIICLPMGFIGYYMKKDKWWGYLILFPMILLTASEYYTYLRYFSFCHPYFLLISVFCAAVIILYPTAIFKNHKIRVVGTVFSLLIVVGISVLVFMKPMRYSTDVLLSVDNTDITEDYQVSLADDQYGDVMLSYEDGIEAYVVHADFKKIGKTELIVRTPSGETKEYDLEIRLFSFDVEEK